MALNKLDGLNSLNSLETFDGGNRELSSEDLLNLARLQGGGIGDTAEEITHGTRSILSTVTKPFKKAFSGFIDVISLPGQVVSGMLSPDWTIAEAIQQKKRISDAIFGSEGIDFNGDGNRTTMEKVGDFIVRTPFDILLDPLTPLTFGAGASKTILQKIGLGLASNSKITVGKEAAKFVGKNIKEGELARVALSEAGESTKTLVQKLEQQITGTTSLNKKLFKEESKKLEKEMMDAGLTREDISLIKSEANTVFTGKKKLYADRFKEMKTLHPDLSDIELKNVLRETLESGVDMDNATKVMANIMTKAPQLAQVILDKGGIKYLGKTILSAQRVAAVKELIPGFTYLDNATLGWRNAVKAPFSAGLLKNAAGVYERVPEEFTEFNRKISNLMKSRKTNYVEGFKDVVEKFGIKTQDDLNILSDALHASKRPEDARLSGAYLELQGMQQKDLLQWEAMGLPKSKLDQYHGLVHVGENTKGYRMNGSLSNTPGTAMEASNFKALRQRELGNELNKTNPEIFDVAHKAIQKGSPLGKTINKLGSPQEVAYTLGNESDRIFKQLLAEGKTVAEASADERIINLKKAQELAEKAITKDDTQLVGVLETHGLVPKVAEEEIALISGKLEVAMEKLNIKKELLTENITKFTESIQEVFKSKTTDVFEKLMLKNGVSKENTKVLLQAIQDSVPELNIDKLKTTGREIVTVENAVGKLKGIDMDSYKRIFDKVFSGVKAFKGDVDTLNKIIEQEIAKNKSLTVVKDATGLAKEQLANINPDEIKKLYEAAAAAKYGYAGRALDKEGLTNLMNVLKDQFESNPSAVKGLIKSLGGAENKLDDVLALMDSTKKSAYKQMAEIGELKTYLKDNEGRIYKRVGTTASELKKAGVEGFDTNLLTSFLVRGMRNQSQLVGQYMMEGLVRNFGRVAGEAPPGWVSIAKEAIDNKTKTFTEGLTGKAGELLFHPQIAKSFDEMMVSMTNGDEITEGFLRKFDDIQNFYKASLTAIFPMFHGRNAISNVFQNFLDMGVNVLDPRKSFQAVQIMKFNKDYGRLMKDSIGSSELARKAQTELTELARKVIFKDRAGYDWTFGELRRVMKNNGIAFNKSTGQFDLGDSDQLMRDVFDVTPESTIGKAGKLAKKVLPVSVDNSYIFKGGRFVAEQIEDHAKILNFVNNLINTGDVSHAAERTGLFLFDYGNLTRFEKEWMKRIIPFFTWTRKNLQLQFETFAKSPGRINAEVQTVQNLGDLFDGEQLTEEQRKLLPEWLKSSITIKLKNQDKIVSGFGTPIEGAFSMMNGNQLLGSISPLIKMPIEFTTGYQWFRGKPTSEVTDASDFQDFPDAVKAFIGYTHYQGTKKDGSTYDVHVATKPENMYVINSLPVSRVIATIGDIKEVSSGDLSVGLGILRGITGVRTSDFNEELLATQKENKLKEELLKMFQDVGIYGVKEIPYLKKNTKIIEN